MVLTQRFLKHKPRKKQRVFPYHYGSYATCSIRERRDVSTLSFHTTMVLTQPSSRKFATSAWYWVSIPLWFLRNEEGLLPDSYTVLSFHTTMVLTQHFYNVRIYNVEAAFPYHYGSYATTGLD